ncbi:hypothetical protein EVAR_31671_1 [Eumeta japonica]|uniref:Uncharacterized protein n=1 Tax=Eumeta variegata TaxID=151549 RepID=A0A4C1VS26_EUMVA|nr:hypothetical protein EVAR_31671_1 [Eumeta japonica]
MMPAGVAESRDRLADEELPLLAPSPLLSKLRARTVIGSGIKIASGTGSRIESGHWEGSKSGTEAVIGNDRGRRQRTNVRLKSESTTRVESK